MFCNLPLRFSRDEVSKINFQIFVHNQVDFTKCYSIQFSANFENPTKLDIDNSQVEISCEKVHSKCFRPWVVDKMFLTMNGLLVEILLLSLLDSSRSAAI